jgi:hypothetical protein
VNLLIKVKRVGHGGRNFANYPYGCCIAASGGKLSKPHDGEVAPTLGGVEPVKQGKRSPSGARPLEPAPGGELTSVSAGQRPDDERGSVSAGQSLVGGRDRV